MAPKLRRAARHGATRLAPQGLLRIFADARQIRRAASWDERRSPGSRSNKASRSAVEPDSRSRSTPRRRSRGVRESTFVYARRGGGGGGGGGGGRGGGGAGRRAGTPREMAVASDNRRAARARFFHILRFTHRSAARPTCTSPWTTSPYNAYLALAARRRREERRRERQLAKRDGGGEGRARRRASRRNDARKAVGSRARRRDDASDALRRRAATTTRPAATDYRDAMLPGGQRCRALF